MRCRYIRQQEKLKQAELKDKQGPIGERENADELLREAAALDGTYAELRTILGNHNLPAVNRSSSNVCLLPGLN